MIMSLVTLVFNANTASKSSAVCCRNAFIYSFVAVFANEARWAPQHPLMLPQGNRNSNLFSSAGSIWSHFLQVQISIKKCQQPCCVLNSYHSLHSVSDLSPFTLRQMCVFVCLYVEPVSRSKDHVWSWIKIGSVLRLCAPVSPSVPEM